MKRNILLALAATAMFTGIFRLAGDDATPAPTNSQLQTHLRVNVDEKTDTVHIISTNNDPDIITKTYVLQHADPYELRPYLRNAVGAERVSNTGSKVEAIKYNDGTGILIISAEDYKFEKLEDGGMTIDELIKILDQPQITSSSGHRKFLYFPKYRSASAINTLITNVGINTTNDVEELDRGSDQLAVDQGLNTILFKANIYNLKNIRTMLDIYDRPIPEVGINYTIYELDSENDGKLGMDFQAWKNGPGTDLFSAASRYAHGWDFANNIVNTSQFNSSHTNYIKFSPIWNTRFLDFLAAKGKAKVISSGKLNIENAQEGRIQALTEIPSLRTGTANTNVTLVEYVQYSNVGIDGILGDGAGAAGGNAGPSGIHIDTDNDGSTDEVSIYPVDYQGNPISISPTNAGQGNNGNLRITRSSDGNRNYYILELNPADGLQFSNSIGNLGIRVRALDGNFTAITTWQTDHSLTINKDNDRTTTVANLLTGNDTYGFQLRMIPSVCEDTTTIDINMYNTSLIGFTNAGVPRTERSEVNTKVMVNNKGGRFVIGGLEKKSVVKSVSKVPWLGSIPVLGWAFAGESEVTKKSQIVAVIECVPVKPDTKISDVTLKEVTLVKDVTDEAGRNNEYGFDQFQLDKEKKEADPLP